jgi:hypothetical protein
MCLRQKVDRKTWQHKLLERSHVPPALSGKKLPGGQKHELIVHRIKQIDIHPAERGEDSAPESVSDNEIRLDWTGDLDKPNESEDNWEVDNESEIELDNGIRDSEAKEEQNASAAPNVSRMIRPTLR